MIELSTSWIDLSSRISASLRATFACGQALGELRQQVRLLRVDSHKLAAAALHGAHLAVDVGVVDADDGKADARALLCLTGASHSIGPHPHAAGAALGPPQRRVGKPGDGRGRAGCCLEEVTSGNAAW